MKGSTYLVLLLVAFASLSASSTAFEPNSVATNPKLANFTEAFYPPQVLRGRREIKYPNFRWCSKKIDIIQRGNFRCIFGNV